MINNIDTKQLQKFDGANSGGGGGGGNGTNYNNQRTPSDAQLNFLRNLKWTYIMPNTMSDAGDLISALKKDGVNTVKADKRWAPLLNSETTTNTNGNGNNAKDSGYCDCAEKQIEEKPQADGPHKGEFMCATCNKPISAYIAEALIANKKAEQASAGMKAN